MKPLRFEDEAEDELAASYDQYEAQLIGLGDAFLAEVDTKLDDIVDMPGRFPITRGTRSQLGIRTAVLGRFPFNIIFMDLPTEVRVVAVAHQRKRPNYWRNRVNKRREQ